VVPGRGYTNAMKYYISRGNGFIQLTCTRCGHMVSTSAFSFKYGNLRTQAATAMNHHAAQNHSSPLMHSSTNAPAARLSNIVSV
jgi:hypothetical protein